MARIEKSIEIEAPVDKVFDFVAAEWEKKMSFFEGVYDWRLTSGKTMGDGARCAYKVKILGTETEIEKRSVALSRIRSGQLPRLRVPSQERN